MKENIGDYIFISLFAMAISVILTPIIRNRCVKRQLLDFPVNPRKIHVTPVPRLGGIAIYTAFFLPLLAIFFTEGKIFDLFVAHFDVLISMLITGTLVFAVGVYDDIKGATVLQKLSIEFLAASLLYVWGFKIPLISIPFVGGVSPGMLGFPLTLLWIVGVTNAINFIDGVDGLACGVGFFGVSTIFILSLFLENTLTAFFAAALAGSLCGFAVYNFAPASIFMGDSGSLFIGFIIAAISLQSSQKSSTMVVLLIPIVALGVPIADTVLAIIRRLGNGHSPFDGDRDHVHHRLLRMGLSSRQVVMVLYAICGVLGVVALLMTAVNNQGLTLLLILLSVMAIVGIKTLGYTADMFQISALAKERIQQKKCLLKQQKKSDELLTVIKISPDIPTLQQAVRTYFETMEFDVGRFLLNHAVIASADLDESVTCLRRDSESLEPSHLWELTVPVIFHQEQCGEIYVGKRLRATQSFLETTISLEHLKYSIEHSLIRLYEKPCE